MKTWYHATANMTELIAKLNALSAEGWTIFSVRRGGSTATFDILACRDE